MKLPASIGPRVRPGDATLASARAPFPRPAFPPSFPADGNGEDGRVFQTFDVIDDPTRGPKRLAALRAKMKAEGVDGFIIPRADAHMGENVAPRDQRLAWLTGFTGSAGTCIALMDRAALFVDGRYTLQARRQTDTTAFEQVAIERTRPEAWLREALPRGGTLAYDPWLHGREEIDRLEDAAEEVGGGLVPLANLIDAIWEDQPEPPCGAVTPYPEALAGESAASKRERIAAELRDAGLAAAAITLPDSICWLLNLRGSDIERSPYLHAFALLREDGGADLFADPAKFDDAARAHLGNEVTLHAPRAFGPALDALHGAKVAVDKASAPVWVSDRLDAAGAETVWRRDPCVLPKAVKNAAELAGSRAAHLRDGAAMARFLRWVEETAPKGGLTEIDAVEKLEGFRAETGALRDISFETICGAGPNGAIVHYRVSRGSNREIVPGDLLLVDSGGQYEDGTTDITRTLATGPVTDEQRRAFTLVLKGMIAIARARWPEGLAGRDLDALARAALWSAGMDYDHGTGHGVGAYLGVHEGPQSLSRRSAEPLLPGMILSDEPGYYREGAFGIRLEILVAVTPPAIPEGGDRKMLGFETLTLAPLDRRLIEPALLDGGERAWLDAYHARVDVEIAPLLDAEDAAWLHGACRPL